MVTDATLAGLAEVAQRSAVVAGLVLLVVTAGLGLMAVRQRSQDPSDLTALFNADTAEFPREHIARHRRPRSWPRLVRHSAGTRRPVSRPRVRLADRPTVRVWIFDPPEGRRG